VLLRLRHSQFAQELARTLLAGSRLDKLVRCWRNGASRHCRDDGWRCDMKIVFAGARCACVAAIVALTAVARPAFSQSEIVIGAPLPLTGALSPEGDKLKAGYELWLQELEKRGGIAVAGSKHKVRLIYSDYQSTTPRAVQLVEKLITSDKVNFMFSPFGSGAIKAASSVAEKYGMPMMASTASSKEVYDQNYINLFGLYTPNETLSEPISQLVKTKFPDVKRVAILARNDLYPLALANEFKKSVEARGLQVVYFEKYAIGTLDHAAAMTQIGAAKPDWIVATGYINDLILIRQQMADQKVTAKVITGINGPQYKEWIDAVGDVGNGVTTASWFHSSLRYNSDDLFGSTENFVKLFQAKYGSDPDFTQASGSAVGVILQMAIEHAGALDRDKVRNVLANSEFKTFFAPIKFGPDGEANSYTPPVFQIHNRRVVVIYPDAIRQAELQPVAAN
jgi:branched-chain amino acid transport system substrate-binding protein